MKCLTCNANRRLAVEFSLVAMAVLLCGLVGGCNSRSGASSSREASTETAGSRVAGGEAEPTGSLRPGSGADSTAAPEVQEAASADAPEEASQADAARSPAQATQHNASNATSRPSVESAASQSVAVSRDAASESSSTAGRIRETTFDDVKFDIEPDEPFSRDMLTDQIEALDGQQIRIRGYILPTVQSRGIKSFVLVRDNMECCFGPGAALYDCILITMEPGKTAEYTIRPVAVEGTFRIDEFKGTDGSHLAIYRMRASNVE